MNDCESRGANNVQLIVLISYNQHSSSQRGMNLMLRTTMRATPDLWFWNIAPKQKHKFQVSWVEDSVPKTAKEKEMVQCLVKGEIILFM
jgi:hypothetical protein